MDEQKLLELVQCGESSKVQFKLFNNKKNPKDNIPKSPLTKVLAGVQGAVLSRRAPWSPKAALAKN